MGSASFPIMRMPGLCEGEVHSKLGIHWEEIKQKVNAGFASLIPYLQVLPLLFLNIFHVFFLILSAPIEALLIFSLGYSESILARLSTSKSPLGPWHIKLPKVYYDQLSLFSRTHNDSQEGIEDLLRFRLNFSFQLYLTQILTHESKACTTQLLWTGKKITVSKGQGEGEGSSGVHYLSC